jgi:hypothetical protein
LPLVLPGQSSRQWRGDGRKQHREEDLRKKRRRKNLCADFWEENGGGATSTFMPPFLTHYEVAGDSLTKLLHNQLNAKPVVE